MNSYVLRGVTKPWSFELEPGLNRLGRNPTNDFRISDASVSSFHCEIIVSKDSILVRDLCSTNGTYIDGQHIQEGCLQPGQTLKVGAAELRLAEKTTEISIPKLTVDQFPTQSRMPDGALACLHHPGTYANFHCPKCQHGFCDGCVRILGLAGSAPKALCPVCSTPCEAIRPSSPKPDERQKESLLGRLTQTIRILRK